MANVAGIVCGAVSTIDLQIIWVYQIVNLSLNHHLTILTVRTISEGKVRLASNPVI